MTRIRATMLQVAQHCPGSVALQRSLPFDPLEERAPELQVGTIGHAYLEIALTAGEGVAAAWLAGDPEAEAALPELADPELMVWVKREVLEGLQGKVEVPALWAIAEGVVISMRHDWAGFIGDRGLVVDWKFGRGQRWYLPPIADDLQMVAYGALAHLKLSEADQAPGGTVTVKRVLVPERRVDSLTIDVDSYPAVEAWLKEICERVRDNHQQRQPGWWCQGCWARNICPERLQQITPVVDALALPQTPVLSLTPLQAWQWAQARGVVGDRVKELDAALLKYLNEGGEVLSNGKRLRVSRYSKDRFVGGNPQLLMSELYMAAGPHSLEALTTSKGRVVEAMKKYGLTKAGIDLWLARWRAAGFIEQEECETLRWVLDRSVVDVLEEGGRVRPSEDDA